MRNLKIPDPFRQSKFQTQLLKQSIKNLFDAATELLSEAGVRLCGASLAGQPLDP